MIVNSKQTKHQSLELPSLPFYWRPLTQFETNELPTDLPFKLHFDPETGLIKQTEDTYILDSLDLVYRQGTEIYGLMDADGTGRKYADDFLDYIHTQVDEKKTRGKKILEIGCGTGYLLNCLQKEDAVVLGYEPGYREIGKYNISVIHDFFPTSETEGHKYDIIIAYAILEHIPEPDKFLNFIYERMSCKSSFILAVPDCSSQIINGDPAMLLHEHFSYFSNESLLQLLKNNRFKLQDISQSNYGGLIYATFSKETGSLAISSSSDITNENEKFFLKFHNFKERFNSFLKSNKNNSIGIYAPIRALNLLWLCRDSIEDNQIKLRFYDDSEILQNKYLPGFNIPIENRLSLIEQSPDHILIFSYTFGNQIRDSLMKELPSQIKLTIIDEL